MFQSSGNEAVIYRQYRLESIFVPRRYSPALSPSFDGNGGRRKRLWELVRYRRLAEELRVSMELATVLVDPEVRFGPMWGTADSEHRRIGIGAMVGQHTKAALEIPDRGRGGRPASPKNCGISPQSWGTLRAKIRSQ